MDVNIKDISFDRGIDRIISSEDRPAGNLPAEGRLAPSERPSTQRLDQLLRVPTLGDALRAELTPAVEDPSLLMPDAYHRALAGVLDQLDTLKAQHPEQAAVFAEARAVLREECGLRELLDFYRNALLKG